MSSFPQGRALIIGISQYQDPQWNVTTAAGDASALAAVLRDPTGAGYDPRAVELLPPERTSRAQILEAVQRLADTATPQTTALISLTCHGGLGDDGNYYLAASDTQFTNDPQLPIVANTGLAIRELAEALRELRAPQAVLLLNACFAGHAGERFGRVGLDAAADLSSPLLGSLPPETERRQLLGGLAGRAIITAGRADQRSYFRTGAEQSYFGAAVVRGLAGATNGANSGYVGLYDLYQFVYDEVRAAVGRVGLQQEPALTIVQGVGPFALAAYRGTATGDAARLRRDLPAEAPIDRVTINVTTKSSLISFDGATIIGDVKTGHVIQRDATFIGGNPTLPTAEEPLEPLRKLPHYRERVAVARNLDPGIRDAAVDELDAAIKALRRGDRIRTVQKLDEAIELLRPLNNGYLNSVIRKLETLRSQLQ